MASAKARALSGVRPTTSTCPRLKAAAKQRSWNAAWTPAPKQTRVRQSGRARKLAARAEAGRLWREVRLYKIAPVSQQMVLNYLAEHALGLPKSY